MLHWGTGLNEGIPSRRGGLTALSQPVGPRLSPSRGGDGVARRCGIVVLLGGRLGPAPPVGPVHCFPVHGKQFQGGSGAKTAPGVVDLVQARITETRFVEASPQMERHPRVSVVHRCCGPWSGYEDAE
jgi:hypothetical protein